MGNYQRLQDGEGEPKFDPATVGFTKREAARLAIIGETDEMRKAALESGGERHLPAIDRLEEMALNLTDENYKEK